MRETCSLGEKTIRVLIASATRALRDLLYNELRRYPGIELVGDVGVRGAIASATERANPDCLIVPFDDPRAPMPICVELLAKRPHMRIVAIGEGTDIVAIYWRSEEGDVRCTYTTATRENIVRAIRFSVV